MNEFKINIEVKGLAELAAAINRLAGEKTGGAPFGGNAPAPGQMPQTGSQMPGQMPPAMTQMQNPVPQTAPQITGQMPPAAPPVPAVPTGAPVQGYSLEQLQVAAAGLMSAGKGQQVMGILQRFGIQAMTELPKERYGEFAMALREAGAQV